MPERGKSKSGRVCFGSWRARLALLACATVFSTNCAADTYPRQPGIKILQYSFDVTLSDEFDELAVKDAIEVQILADNVRGIELDLCKLLTTTHAPDRL